MKRLLYILLIIVLNLSLVVGCIPPDKPLGPEVPIVGALKLSQEQMMVDAEGGEFSVDVFTEYSYETITNADWITTSGGSCGPDYCTLYFTVAKNNSGAEREGVITFFCDDYNLSATLTIVQEAGSEQGSDTSIPNNQIWYTSSNGEIVTPYATDVFGANIVSNTYENGKGVITFDDDASSIGDAAFAYCSSLTSVTIPDSISSIGEYAFYGCTSLTSITIPDRVTSIGSSAFRDCSSLTSVTIPNSVTSIGDYAFYGCSGRLIIDSKVVEKDRPNWSSPTWLAGSNFTEIVIGDSITKIGSTAFYDYQNIRSLTIGNNVTEIGKDAFSECHNIETINLGTNLTNIGNYAFNKNFSLTSVTIPESITSIGYEAFNECTSLAHVYCKPTTPPTGNSYMFDDNASGRKIYVPRNSVDAYKSAQYWKDYKSYIVGYDF